jgi:hypothetical protein
MTKIIVWGNAAPARRSQHFPKQKREKTRKNEKKNKNI